eukprot:gene13364-biopygen5021
MCLVHTMGVPREGAGTRHDAPLSCGGEGVGRPGWYRGSSGSWTGSTALECSGYQCSKLWGQRTAPGAAKPGSPRHGTALHPTPLHSTLLHATARHCTVECLHNAGQAARLPPFFFPRAEHRRRPPHGRRTSVSHTTTCPPKPPCAKRLQRPVHHPSLIAGGRDSNITAAPHRRGLGSMMHSTGE